ncbi:hypothetical protein [Sedimentitalea todarodis]|uniref:SnoaL-like domain-containing protein n=1 Tax=Sedimentitalea todarodis TaxID=1631240 RepID=A0ABU3VCX4_9RHOB|nr:hypothetical protein [Sedimentitalea todarodis]MDU9003928.1 hypothetical protein [Sedimentitalea todarodis]
MVRGLAPDHNWRICATIQQTRHIVNKLIFHFRVVRLTREMMNVSKVLQAMVANQEYSGIQATVSEVAAGPAADFPTRPDWRSETCHCVFLDQVQVVDGVCHKQTIRAVGDLISGDEYRFPDMIHDSPSSIRVEGENATIEFRTIVEVGSSNIRARLTHCITLMSGRGHLVTADVLTTSANRVLLALRDTVMPREDYALISKVTTQARKSQRQATAGG